MKLIVDNKVHTFIDIKNFLVKNDNDFEFMVVRRTYFEILDSILESDKYKQYPISSGNNNGVPFFECAGIKFNLISKARAGKLKSLL